jgi:flagellar biosynthesis protein FliQ
MNADVVLELLKQTLSIALMIAGPLLLLTLVVGVGINIFQAVTSVQEMTLSFVPKVVTICLALVIGGPWMLQELTKFTVAMISRIPDFVK